MGDRPFRNTDLGEELVNINQVVAILPGYWRPGDKRTHSTGFIGSRCWRSEEGARHRLWATDSSPCSGPAPGTAGPRAAMVAFGGEA